MYMKRRHPETYYRVEKLLKSYIPIVELIEKYEKQYNEIREEMHESGYTAVAYNNIRVQSSAIKKPVEDNVVRNVGRLIRIEKRLNELLTQKQMLDIWIDTVKNEKLAYLLDKYYRVGKFFYEVHQDMGVSRQMAHKYQRQAIYELITVYQQRGKELGLR